MAIESKNLQPATVLQDDHRTTFVDVDYHYNRDADDADVHHHRQKHDNNSVWSWS